MASEPRNIITGAPLNAPYVGPRERARRQAEAAASRMESLSPNDIGQAEGQQTRAMRDVSASPMEGVSPNDMVGQLTRGMRGGPAPDEVAEANSRRAAQRARRAPNTRMSPRAAAPREMTADELNDLSLRRGVGGEGPAAALAGLRMQQRLAEMGDAGGMKKGGAVKKMMKRVAIKKMASGGVVKSSASGRADGCAARGKTKGRMV
ncbi:hypothetical protein UFOVP1302_12 [uncultured Caudovirales phage]|uniref:Uncharacterized protein n=1 Tax=uncultured Caudovirales phage TaxID=2100421 RepID=A0A6J5QK74_9CAUD|nr:hypothetical protein UFOVP895_15 [uncultured Caudovirales phage]CAB4181841.1 hypothetical protein UFOVP1070_71 [uncultured Caudovirales phage]CAB4195452.1 hypothetical protein UFOVP1302_12 [uncultured Caudovirales phage]CAB4211686.1 hypothetical protein UFOVP1416_19 [uncultured Caudovirales phage]